MTSRLLTGFIGIPACATRGGETSAPAPVPICSRNAPCPRRYGRTRIATASLHLPTASLLSLLLCATASAIPVDKIPDPRPASAVVDMTGTLLLTDKAAIDSEAARGSTGGTLVVVVVGSVDGDTPRAYTTRLFNRWQLDSRTRNKGVLLLAALTDRKVEIVVGDGFGDNVTTLTDAVMRETLMPALKAGDPRGALVHGARALVDKLLLPAEVATSAVKATGAVQPPPTVPEDAQPTEPPSHAPVHSPPDSQLSEPASSPERPALERINRYATDNPVPLYGGGAASLLALFLGVRRYFRNRPRNCPACRSKMVRLTELADDAHLKSGEITEEQLGSADYDIWMCNRCQEVTKERYGAFFTSYSRCGACNYKTVKRTSQTLSAATHYASGLAEVTEDCLHCGNHQTFTRTIPRLSQSSSSSFHSSGSGSSGSRSGGSSSGRGSSGSW